MSVVNVENACTSGSTAVHQAYYDVAYGKYDLVLVVGFEKMKKGVIDIGQGKGVRPLDEKLGFLVMPARYAMKANRHMYEYGTTLEQIAKVSVKSHKNGVFNPIAHYQKEVTIEEVLNSRMIADPLTLLQACPTSDGAAAVIIASEKYLNRGNKKDAIKITGTALLTQSSRGEDLVERTSKAAYEMAGIQPQDVNVAEVHDAFSIGELLHYESLGFCARGEAGRLIDEGVTEIQGKLPVNPSGGLLSKGHPLGVTGVAQIIEVVYQLRGDAKQRQIQNNPKVGLTHTSGAGGVCCVTILSK